MTLSVRVVRVFADEAGRHGNPLGIVLDAGALPGELGPRLTAHLGFSETVFVDDAVEGNIRIFNPVDEMRLAGHPLVGVARVLAEVNGAAPKVLRPRLAGPVDTWQDGELSWIRSDTSAAPAFSFTRMASAKEVEAMAAPSPDEHPLDQFWAWIDEAAGQLRARTFAAVFGMGEDEATGSAALLQALRLGRELTIRQGRGSVLHARPADRDGWAEVAGRVVDEPDVDVDL